MEEGDFLALFTIDSKIVVGFIKVFSVLFSAPTTLITSQAFLYAEVGKYGVCMTVVVVLGLAVQVLIDWKISKYSTRKLDHYQDRVTFNI